jgi:hypothetical protein
MFITAAKHGFLDGMKYLHEAGCPTEISSDVSRGLADAMNAPYYAVVNGHLDCVTYLAETVKYPLIPMLVIYAARNADMKMLTYLIETAHLPVTEAMKLELRFLPAMFGDRVLPCCEYLLGK